MQGLQECHQASSFTLSLSSHPQLSCWLLFPWLCSHLLQWPQAAPDFQLGSCKVSTKTEAWLSVTSVVSCACPWTVTTHGNVRPCWPRSESQDPVPFYLHMCLQRHLRPYKAAGPLTVKTPHSHPRWTTQTHKWTRYGSHPDSSWLGPYVASHNPANYD